MRTTVAKQLASSLCAVANCIASGNTEWEQKHGETIDQIMRDRAPSGGGIDAGTTLDRELSTENKLVFHTAFHHMNDVGTYDGWTEHTVTVRPHLVFGLDIKISGRDRNEIKEYLHDVFYTFLTTEIGE